jgi:hypothetical protein
MWMRPYGGDIILRNYDDGGNFSPHFMTMGGIFRGGRKFDGTGTFDSKTYVRTNNNLTIIANPATSGEFRKVPNIVNAGNETAEEAAFNNYFLINEKTYRAPSQTQFWRNGFYEQRSEDPQNPRIDSMKILVDEANPNTIRVWVSRPTYTEVTAEIINGGTAILHSDGSNMVARWTGSPLGGLYRYRSEPSGDMVPGLFNRRRSQLGG